MKAPVGPSFTTRIPSATYMFPAGSTATSPPAIPGYVPPPSSKVFSTAPVGLYLTIRLLPLSATKRLPAESVPTPEGVERGSVLPQESSKVAAADAEAAVASRASTASRETVASRRCVTRVRGDALAVVRRAKVLKRAHPELIAAIIHPLCRSQAVQECARSKKPKVTGSNPVGPVPSTNVRCHVRRRDGAAVPERAC